MSIAPHRCRGVTAFKYIDDSAKCRVFAGTLIAVQRPARRHQERGRRPFSKAQPNTMYGDPFLSLVVAVLFAIVFYNHSSIPNGQSYDSQNMRDPRVRN
jgi:hypothetical protein